MRKTVLFGLLICSSLTSFAYSMNAPGTFNRSAWPYSNYYNGNWGYQPYYYYQNLPPQTFYQPTPTYFNWHSPSPYRPANYDCPWCQQYQMQQNNQFNNSLPTWHSPMAS